MKVRNGIALLGLLAAACSTNGQRGDFVITKVVEATGTPPACVFDTGTKENLYSVINPTTNIGLVAAVVQNNLIDPSSINPDLMTNTAQFQPHQIVVSYEVLPRTAGAAPPYTIASQIIAVSGVTVPQGSTGTVGGPLFQPGVLPATAATGDFIRTTFHIEGTLGDGRTASTSSHEYLFQVNTTTTVNPCM